MQAKLFCKTGQLAGASFSITGDASIGKAADNAIQLYPEIVSSHHARIYFDSKRGSYIIDDLNSRNGTRVDGASVRGSAQLERLNVITFADKFDFVFQVLDESAAQPRAKKDAPRGERSVAPQRKSGEEAAPSAGRNTVMDDAGYATPRLARETPVPMPPDAGSAGKTVFGDAFEAMPNIPAAPIAQDEAKRAALGKTMLDDAWGAPSIPGMMQQAAPQAEPQAAPQAESAGLKFSLTLIAIDGTRTVFTLKEGENTVGRDPGSDVAIEDGSMSRAHAVVIVSGGNVRIKDLGSKNGTFIGDARVHDETVIAPGSELRFGVATLQLVAVR